jgi:cysteinyl-tRNA synthetase
MHNAHLVVNGEKMSKSLHNFYTLRDIVKAGFSPRIIRYFLLSAHYRQPLNLVYEPASAKAGSFEAARGALERIDEFRAKLDEVKTQHPDSDRKSQRINDLITEADSSFRSSLENDLDISGALGALFSLIKEGNRLIASQQMTAADAEAVHETLLHWDKVLEILKPEEKAGVDARRIETLIQERNRARRDRNFARSDEIRDLLASEGILIQDTPQGTRWRRK